MSPVNSQSNSSSTTRCPRAAGSSIRGQPSRKRSTGDELGVFASAASRSFQSPGGSADEETCARGTRKPTNAINATTAKAALPATSSKAENDFGAKVEFMTLRVKISRLTQLVDLPGEQGSRATSRRIARCRRCR